MSFQRYGLTSKQVAAPQAVLRVAKKGEPGGTTPVRFRPVVNAQNTANHVLVNFNPESQSDLLSDARTAPRRIPAFHLHHGIDEFFGRALGAGTTPARRRKQQPILSLDQHAVDSVDGRSTMAERSSRARQMKSVHTPAMKRSATRKLGAACGPDSG